MEEVVQLFEERFIDSWAERLVRRDVLRALVPDSHPAAEAEQSLLLASSEEAGLRLSRAPSPALADAVSRAVLARAAAYLRSYGCPKSSLAERVAGLRPDVEAALPRSWLRAS